jgi:hypothetical protein
VATRVPNKTRSGILAPLTAHKSAQQTPTAAERQSITDVLHPASKLVRSSTCHLSCTTSLQDAQMALALDL